MTVQNSYFGAVTSTKGHLQPIGVFVPKLWFVGYQILQIFSSPLVDLSRTWKGSLVQLHMNQAWFHMTVQNSYFGAVTSTKGHLQLCRQDTVRLTVRLFKNREVHPCLL